MPGFGGGNRFAAGTQPVSDNESHIRTRREMMERTARAVLGRAS
jgi:hypothetical protein